MSLHSEQKINFQDRETPPHTELSSRRVYWGCILGSRHGADLGCHCSGEFEPLGGTFVWSTGFLFVRLYQGDKSDNMSYWCRFFLSILRRFPWANADSQWLHEDWRFECRLHDPPKPTLVAFPSFLDFSPVLSSPWRAQWRAGRGRSCWASSWWLGRRITSTNSSACSPKWSVS